MLETIRRTTAKINCITIYLTNSSRFTSIIISNLLNEPIRISKRVTTHFTLLLAQILKFVMTLEWYTYPSSSRDHKFNKKWKLRPTLLWSIKSTAPIYNFTETYTVFGYNTLISISFIQNTFGKKYNFRAEHLFLTERVNALHMRAKL